MARVGPRANVTTYDRVLEVVVDRTAARYGAWYELFPRSASDDASRHGTFDDVIARAALCPRPGLRRALFPADPSDRRHQPQGPQQRAARRSPATRAAPMRSAAGRRPRRHPSGARHAGGLPPLVDAARRHGLEIALDFAIQCSPDHPWMQAAPGMVPLAPRRHDQATPRTRRRSTRTSSTSTSTREALPSLWFALRDAVLFWVEQGVRIFRVDNPHTKPMPFWQWLIAEVHGRHPDVLFLAEAFTRPKMMQRLAKVGFTQSYTYFTWRNTKHELTEYLTELTQQRGDGRTIRPNFFVNTPDINPRAAADRRPARSSRRARCWPARCPACGACIQASSCARPRRCPAARST